MVTNNGESKPNKLGTDAHDEEFEGSCKLYADHLVNDHGYTDEQVSDWRWGNSQGDWTALDHLHRIARSLDT